MLHLVTQADGYFTEIIHGMKTVQLFVREEKEREYVNDWIKNHRKLRNDTDYIRGWYAQILSNFQQSLGIGIILAFGAWQIINAHLSIGSLLAFTVYIPLLYTSIEAIQRAYVGYKTVQPAKLYVQEVLHTEDSLENKTECNHNMDIKGSITFHKVFFDYEQGRRTLQDVSVTVI